MAGLMNSIYKGVAAINVKTSTITETSKLKTVISSREDEIAMLMKTIGETVYINRASFNMEMVSEMLEAIKTKYDEIESCKSRIALLEENERSIFGKEGGAEAKLFCTQCGAPNGVGDRFCEKCGASLTD